MKKIEKLIKSRIKLTMLLISVTSLIIISVIQEKNHTSSFFQFMNSQDTVSMLAFSISIWGLYGIYIGFLQYITQDSQDDKYMYLGRSKLDYIIENSIIINLANTFTFKSIFAFLIILPFAYDFTSAQLSTSYTLITKLILYVWQSTIILSLFVYILLIKESIKIMNSTRSIHTNEMKHETDIFFNEKYLKKINKQINSNEKGSFLSDFNNSELNNYEKTNIYINNFKKEFPELSYSDELIMRKYLYRQIYFNTRAEIEQSKEYAKQYLDEIISILKENEDKKQLENKLSEYKNTAKANTKSKLDIQFINVIHSKLRIFREEKDLITTKAKILKETLNSENLENLKEEFYLSDQLELDRVLKRVTINLTKTKAEKNIEDSIKYEYRKEFQNILNFNSNFTEEKQLFLITQFMKNVKNHLESLNDINKKILKYSILITNKLNKKSDNYINEDQEHLLILVFMEIRQYLISENKLSDPKNTIQTFKIYKKFVKCKWDMLCEIENEISYGIWEKLITTDIEIFDKIIEQLLKSSDDSKIKEFLDDNQQYEETVLNSYNYWTKENPYNDYNIKNVFFFTPHMFLFSMLYKKHKGNMERIINFIKGNQMIYDNIIEHYNDFYKKKYSYGYGNKEVNNLSIKNYYRDVEKYKYENILKTYFTENEDFTLIYNQTGSISNRIDENLHIINESDKININLDTYYVSCVQMAIIMTRKDKNLFEEKR